MSAAIERAMAMAPVATSPYQLTKRRLRGAAADRRQMAITLRNIAAIYYWREELELVERYTQDILAIERELGNLPAVARARSKSGGRME